MADIPKDPRQLARDILAGKISIEDLAREQQRRRAAAGGAAAAQPMPQANLPDRVPLPRLGNPPMPPPPQSTPPHRTPSAARPQQQPRQFPPRPASARPAGPNIDRRPAPPLTQRAAPPLAPAKIAPPQDNAYAAPASIQDARALPSGNPRFDVRSIARNHNTLRQSILMAEILAKPLSLRHDR